MTDVMEVKLKECSNFSALTVGNYFLKATNPSRSIASGVLREQNKPRIVNARPCLILSEEAEIVVVAQSLGGHVDVDVRVQLCDPGAHSLDPGAPCERRATSHFRS